MAKWPCAVQGASLTPPCTFLQLSLLFHIDSITLAPLTLLVARSYLIFKSCVYRWVYRVILILVCQRSGGGFCCSFCGGCGDTLRVAMAFQPFQIGCGFFCKGLHTKEIRAMSCGCAASAVLLVAITRSSAGAEAGAEAAARASVARQP